MLTIKAAASLAGLTIKAVRHYENLGLVKPSARTAAGYRLYSDEEIFRLSRIQYFRELKFSLREVAWLLDAPQEQVQQALLAQREVVVAQMEEYRRAQTILDAVLTEEDAEPVRTPGKRRVAIVALDLQNDILEGGALPCKRIQNILPPLSKLFAKARSMGVPIIYVCDWHYKDDPELKLWPNHMIAHTYGAQIINEVAPMPGDIVVHKNRFNGFLETPLHDILQKLNIDTVLMTGWRSHVCVTQTAIEAFYKGYRVAIAEDGVDSTTQNEHDHGMSLMQINYGFELIPCESALETLLQNNN